MTKENDKVILSNSDVDGLFVTIKKRMLDIANAGEKGDVARADLVRCVILLGASDASRATEFAARARCIFADPKSHQTEYAGAWQYFNNLLDMPARMTADQEPDRAERDRHNNKVSAGAQFVRYLCQVIVAVDKSNTWGEFSAGKGQGILKLTIPGAMALFPKRNTSLGKSEFNYVVVTHRAGEYRMSTIADAGGAILLSEGVKRAGNTRAAPVRDVVEQAGNTVENADAKAFDATTRKATLSALVKMIDAMNDSNVTNHLDSKIVAPFRAHVVELFEREEKASAPVAPVAVSVAEVERVLLNRTTKAA